MLNFIKSRRSIAKFTKKDIPDNYINQIIEVGCFAPCYKRTEPWRFTVFKGEYRKHLQTAIEKNIINNEKNSKEQNRKLARIKNKAYRSPVIIAVWCAVGRCLKNPEPWEEKAAVAACLQNMSLAAHGLGLGSIWRTGDFVNMPEVQELCKTNKDNFTASKGDKIMGFLYIGHIDNSKSTPTRSIDGWQNKVNWLDDLTIL